ncbi:MAG: AtpZ/AtpI family protein [Nitrospirae bacterium]|nr:AtpZ/AtpI family protein [Nitrospirota bacterium]
MPEKEKTVLRQLWEASTVGLNFVISTIVGGVIGYGLDYAMESWFSIKTKPWLLFIFALLGIIAGFRYLFRIASSKKENESGKKDL